MKVKLHHKSENENIQDYALSITWNSPTCSFNIFLLLSPTFFHFSIYLAHISWAPNLTIAGEINKTKSLVNSRLTICREQREKVMYDNESCCQSNKLTWGARGGVLWSVWSRAVSLMTWELTENEPWMRRSGERTFQAMEDQRPWGGNKLAVFKDQKKGLYGWNTVNMRWGYKLGLQRAQDLVGQDLVEIYISFYI